MSPVYQTAPANQWFRIQLVILVICVMVLLWIVASYLEMQRALQWWFKRQSTQLTGESEYIHNGALQEIFAIRRSLESSLVDGAGISLTQSQDWLNKTERLHESLERLSEVLSPPYLIESLPLAIQSLLKRFQMVHPTLDLTVDLPTNWIDEPPERSRMIVTSLNDLLTLTLPAAIAGPHRVCLRSEGQTAELAVQILYPDRSTLITHTHSQDMKYLRRCFQCLTPGRCLCHIQDLHVTWRFRWKLQGPYPLK